jgi:hypothetical protein
LANDPNERKQLHRIPAEFAITKPAFPQSDNLDNVKVSAIAL